MNAPQRTAEINLDTLPWNLFGGEGVAVPFGDSVVYVGVYAKGGLYV